MAFDPKLAVLYGQFIEAAYSMYEKDRTDLTPPQSSNFPATYTLTAWVQMRDFLFSSTGLVFYGFIAHSTTDPTQAVLAIRGTDNGLEWWDDINSIGMTPFLSNCGNVGLGWENIFQTLELVERSRAAGAAPQSLKQAGRFSAQVKEHLQRQAAGAGAPQAATRSHRISFTGHSLGAALATICAAEDALLYKIRIEALYTFGSPKVGDSWFADAFNKIGLNSWRIANRQDIVPFLPLALYEHVDTLQQCDSTGRVRKSVPCWHAMATYLSLIDSSLPPDPECRLPVQVAGRSV